MLYITSLLACVIKLVHFVSGEDEGEFADVFIFDSMATDDQWNVDDSGGAVRFQEGFRCKNKFTNVQNRDGCLKIKGGGWVDTTISTKGLSRTFFTVDVYSKGNTGTDQGCYWFVQSSFSPNYFTNNMLNGDNTVEYAKNVILWEANPVLPDYNFANEDWVKIGFFGGSSNDAQSECWFDNFKVYGIPIDDESDPDYNAGFFEWRDASWGEYAFNAALYMPYNDPTTNENREYVCSASILSLDGGKNGNGVMLTAAHCLEGVTTAELLIGSTTVRYRGNDNGFDGTLYSTSDWEVHPDWDPTLEWGDAEWGAADVALLYLNAPITDQGAMAVRLHSELDIETGDEVQVFGWFGRRDGSCIGCSDMAQLECMWASYLDDEQCAAFFEDLNWMTSAALYGRDDVVCLQDIAYDDGWSSTCGGDSGGPNVYKGKQIAMNSFGSASCHPGQPGGKANVAKYYDWIYSECPNCLQYEDEYISDEVGSDSGNRRTDILFTRVNRAAEYVGEICVRYDGTSINKVKLTSDRNEVKQKGSQDGDRLCWTVDDGSCFTSVQVVQSGQYVVGLKLKTSNDRDTRWLGQEGAGNGDSLYRVNPPIYGYCLYGVTVGTANPVRLGKFTDIQFVWRDVEDIEMKFMYNDDAMNGDGNSGTIVSIVAVVVAAFIVFGVIGYVLYKRYVNKKELESIKVMDLEEAEVQDIEEENNDNAEETVIDGAETERMA